MIRAETLRAEIERLEAARAAVEGSEPSTRRPWPPTRHPNGSLKYPDAPWERLGITRAAWYLRLRAGTAFDARYRPRTPWRQPLQRRPVNGGVEAVQ
jgi:hypothetical protein